MQRYSYLRYWICDDKRFEYVKINTVNCLEKNNSIFQTTRFNHTMNFFKVTDQYNISDIYINHNNCTVKKNSVNPFCLIFGKVNRYFEKINGNKYLTLVPANESRETINKYEEL